MKKVEHYICEVCGTEYADEEKCGRCEKGHRKPTKIVGSRYRPITMDQTGCPEMIDVQMNDGRTVRYRKLRQGV